MEKKPMCQQYSRKGSVMTPPPSYRLVSLTCLRCELLELVIVSNVLKHLYYRKILSDCQYSFRARRSCETQLVTLCHDLTLHWTRGSKQTCWSLISPRPSTECHTNVSCRSAIISESEEACIAGLPPSYLAERRVWS